MTATVLELITAALLVLGGIFGLVGSWGLLRLRDPFQRLHAPTKATTIGVGTALIASDIEFFALKGHVAWEEIVVAVFLFLTAPLSAMMLAKVLLWQQRQARNVPPPSDGGDWAVWSSGPTAGEAATEAAAPDAP